MSIDQTFSARNRVLIARVDPALPLGLHRPKLDGDIGWDIEAMHDVVIPPMESVDVAVNIRMALPPGVYVDIRNRSSMAKRGLYVDHNLIDSGYRGPLFVLVRNLQLPVGGHYVAEPGSATWEEHSVPISAGERVGQLVFHRSMPVWTHEVDEIHDDTERGDRGFGSTGR
jgi:dUTP pyrophosphatase